MKKTIYFILLLFVILTNSCTKTHSEKGIKKWEGSWKIDLYHLKSMAKDKFFTNQEYKNAELSVADYGQMTIDKDLNGKLTLNGEESTFYLYYSNSYHFNLKNWRKTDGSKILNFAFDFHFLIEDEIGKERVLEIDNIYPDIFPFPDTVKRMYLMLKKV